MFSHKNICLVCLELYLLFLFGFLFFSSRVYSKEQAAASIDEIVFLEGKKDAITLIESTLKKHGDCVTISYPGITKDFKRYKKNNYSDFLDELSLDSGYYAGIITGMCISFDDPDKDSVNFQFNYMTSKKQEKYISRKVKQIVKKYRGQSAYNKIKGAHDYITSHTAYDANYCNPYYVFKKGKGICMSYALAFQRILTEMKIPCIYVKGDNHAWNMVRIDGKWYGVDVTWDDSRGSYGYFLKGTNDFCGHDNSDSKVVKRIRKAKYSYKR